MGKNRKYMRGAVLCSVSKPLQIMDEIEIPELRKGQVLVKNAYSGICRSQLMEVRGLRGDDKFLPHLTGHEGCGQVIEVGESVTKVKKGDWVILGWIKSSGLDVPGPTYKCRDMIINSGPVTTFSEFSVVSENRVVKLPSGVPKDIGVLFGCALPTGAGLVLNEINPKKKSSIAIVGLGGVGLSSLMAVKTLDCDPVIAIDISDDKLDMATRFGATHVINSSENDAISIVMDITEGKGVDYSIEAAGQTSTIELAFEILNKSSGQCVFASHPPEGDKISLNPHHLISGRTIKGSWGGESKPDKDIPKLAKFYKNGLLPLETLVTKKYSLDDINKALDDLENFKVYRPIISFGD